MTTRLLIHYKADNQMLVAALNEQGRLVDEPERRSFAEIAERYPAAQATLLIDSMLLHFARIALPGNNRQRQLQAAPYALEDQLACDIDELHFTLGKRESDDLIAVTCINKNLLQNLLENCRNAGLQPDAVCPDVLALPLADQQWPVLIDEDSICIRTSAQSGFRCERDNLPLLLPALLQHSAQPPQTLLVLAPEQDDVQSLFTGIDIPRVHQTFHQSIMQLFALHLNDARSMNLLQGEFTIKRQTSLQWKAWRLAAIAASIWIGLQLLVAGLEIQMLNRIHQQLTVETEAEFKRIFPDAKKFSGMESRVKQRLKQLQGGQDDSQEMFLQMLADAAPALGTEGLNIRGIAYRERHIDLDLQAASLQILEEAKTRLDTQRKLKATLSTSVEKDRVNGRLRLELSAQGAEGKQG